MGFPGDTHGNELTCQCRRHIGDAGLIPGWGKSLGGGHENSPVFLPRESYGQRSLEGYSPWYRKESDMTEVT